MTCGSCGAALDGAPRFCHECGAAVEPSGAAADLAGAPATRTLLGTAMGATAEVSPRPSRSTSASTTTTSSSDSLDGGRFVPGTLLQDRYRVIALLGRGGMGEVYRADDLRLGQTVALKFLPPEVMADPGRRARFHNEARLARQVSHPSVCRVYDIGDIDGQVFMSMEYIDGEDLGTLLRRIGRLPKDKAIEIARQMCAGLAAAHDRGVLHRDLKPSNVMIDGRGRARLADFGLAALAGGMEAEGTRAGTPAYMAPEHIGRGETSVKSDLYALGLVLYELFTGRRVFSGDSVADLVRLHSEVAPIPPSSVVEEFDPVIERVILRCLEKDPRERPASALAVAAALPGGDPLAMALAAGETPSPEMVAAAGEAGALTPAAVWGCLLAIGIGMALLAPLMSRQTLVQVAGPMKAPAVLADRARGLIAKFGWPDPPADAASGLGYHRSYLEHLRDEGGEVGAGAFGRTRPHLLYLWYRQSPRALAAANPDGIVSTDDPPETIPGMASVLLTGSGDLFRFFAVPPQRDEAGGPPPAPVDWSPFFAEAGLDPADFRSVEPEWSPPSYADTRAAWIGRYADTPEWPLRVEAASYRGRAVAFRLVWPWSRPLLMRPFEQGAGDRVANGVIAALIAAAMLGGLVIARRNIRQGKGDQRGAFRLAVAMFAAAFVARCLNASHQAGAIEEWFLIMLLAMVALFGGGVIWLYYIALEPLVRRRWPDRIIAWTRLVSGRARDPLVGREILIGVVMGVGMALLRGLTGEAAKRLGAHPLLPVGGVDRLQSPAIAAGAVLDTVPVSTGQALVMLFLIVFLRAVLRRGPAATATFATILAGVVSLEDYEVFGGLAVVWGGLVAAILTYAIARVGLLALTAALFSTYLVVGQPIVFGPANWYAGAAVLPILAIAALTAWAARAALAGRSLFDLRLLAD